MALSLTAYLNQRFQFTYDVTQLATVFSGLNAAEWFFQVRPSAGSPTLLLDCRTGGSPQSALALATYSASGGFSQITTTAPTTVIQGIQPGTYVFDFGFILSGFSDFERVDGGVITFSDGTTLAGVTGTPAAPAGGDDTVSLNSGSIVTQVPQNMTAALGAANSNATAAATHATAAAGSATAAAASATAAAISAVDANNAYTNAVNSAVTIINLALSHFFFETLTATGTNTLPALTHAPSGMFSILTAHSLTFMPVNVNPPYTISGTAITWSATNSGVTLSTGDKVVIGYTY